MLYGPESTRASHASLNTNYVSTVCLAFASEQLVVFIMLAETPHNWVTCAQQGAALSNAPPTSNIEHLLWIRNEVLKERMFPNLAITWQSNPRQVYSKSFLTLFSGLTPRQNVLTEKVLSSLCFDMWINRPLFPENFSGSEHTMRFYMPCHKCGEKQGKRKGRSPGREEILINYSPLKVDVKLIQEKAICSDYLIKPSLSCRHKAFDVNYPMWAGKWQFWNHNMITNTCSLLWALCGVREEMERNQRNMLNVTVGLLCY